MDDPKEKKNIKNMFVGILFILAIGILIFIIVIGIKNTFVSDLVYLKGRINKTLNIAIDNQSTFKKQFKSSNDFINQIKKLTAEASNLDYINFNDLSMGFEIDDKNKTMRIFSKGMNGFNFDAKVSDEKGVVTKNDLSFNINPSTLGKDYNSWSIEKDVIGNSKKLFYKTSEGLNVSYSELIKTIDAYKTSANTDSGDLAILIEKAEIIKEKTTVDENGKKQKIKNYTITLKKDDINNYLQSMTNTINNNDFETDLEYVSPKINRDIKINIQEYKKNIFLLETKISDDLEIKIELTNKEKPEEGLYIKIDFYDQDILLKIDGQSLDKNILDVTTTLQIDDISIGKINVKINLKTKNDNLMITVGDLGFMGSFLGFDTLKMDGNIKYNENSFELKVNKFETTGKNGTDIKNATLSIYAETKAPAIKISTIEKNLFDFSVEEMEKFLYE